MKPLLYLGQSSLAFDSFFACSSSRTETLESSVNSSGAKFYASLTIIEENESLFALDF